MTRGRLSSGFSLIELLIVVAIIAALVGVAVPFFADNVNEAQRTKAKQDMQVLYKAIFRYEQIEERPLLGTSLEPLLGRYIQELPKDPWGNQYLWDGNLGFLASYGADALPDGSGGDEDIIYGGVDIPGMTLNVRPVFPRRAQYQGTWGPPKPPPGGDFTRYHEGNKFIVTFTRPVWEDSPADLPRHVKVEPGATIGALGNQSPLSEPTSWAVDTWKSAADPAYFAGMIDPLHRPDEGVVVVRARVDNRGVAGAVPIRPSTVMTFADLSDVTNLPASLVTTFTPNATPASPLDPAVYGPVVATWMPPVLGPPEVEKGQLGGQLRIERY